VLRSSSNSSPAHPCLLPSSTHFLIFLPFYFTLGQLPPYLRLFQCWLLYFPGLSDISSTTVYFYFYAGILLQL
jgi:hypothetical protein